MAGFYVTLFGSHGVAGLPGKGDSEGCGESPPSGQCGQPLQDAS